MFVNRFGHPVESAIECGCCAGTLETGDAFCQECNDAGCPDQDHRAPCLLSKDDLPTRNEAIHEIRDMIARLYVLRPVLTPHGQNPKVAAGQLKDAQIFLGMLVESCKVRPERGNLDGFAEFVQAGGDPALYRGPKS